MQITTLTIIGWSMLLFRIWLAEFKLKEELQFRRHYLSRFVNIYMWIAFIFNLESYTFNLIVITCFPVMIVTSFWDIKFYTNFKKRDYWTKNKGWLLIERLTLHPPMLALGLFFYLSGILPYFNYSRGIWPAVIAVSIVYIAFFLFDKRWTEKYNYPQSKIMISMMILSTAITLTMVYIGQYL